MAMLDPWDDMRTIQIPAPFDSAYRVMINDTPYVVTPDELGYAEVPLPVYERLQEMIDAKERYPVAKSCNTIAKMNVIVDEYAGGGDITATCENMTFAEACEIVKAGEKLDVIVTATANGLVMTGYAIGVMYEPASWDRKAAKATEAPTPESLGIITHMLINNAFLAWTWTADGITGTDAGLTGR